MKLKIFAAIAGIFAAYLFVSQATVNTALMFCYLAAIAVFTVVSVYKHNSDEVNYRFDTSVMWVDLISTILIVALTVQFAGKAIAV